MIDVLGPEKRRRRTTQEKIAIVQQSFEPGMTVSLVARQHGVAASQLFLWRKQYQEGSLTAVAAGEQVARYWFTIGQSGVFSLGGWSPHIQTGYHVSRPTHRAHSMCIFVYGAVTLYRAPFQTLPLTHTLIQALGFLGNTGTDVCLAGSDHREISGATRKNEMCPGGNRR